ncbi:hypothetical protein ACS0TY_013717 [Phlomoides rotata]
MYGDRCLRPGNSANTENVEVESGAKDEEYVGDSNVKADKIVEPGHEMSVVGNPIFVLYINFGKERTDLLALTESKKRKINLDAPVQNKDFEVDGSGEVSALCELAKARRPDVIFLFETLFVASRVEEIRVKLNFESCFNVNCVGRSGGICVFWRVSSICNVVSFSNNHIGLMINNTGSEWRVTGYNGFPQRYLCSNSWALLRTFGCCQYPSWLCLWDFNDLLFPEDKRGWVDHPN